jgi:hypothetical protein
MRGTPQNRSLRLSTLPEFVARCLAPGGRRSMIVDRRSVTAVVFIVLEYRSLPS